MIRRGDLATSSSDLRYEIVYQEVGGQIQYRCFLLPYDTQTARLLRLDKGDFFLSYHSAAGKALVPREEAHRIPLNKMAPFKSGDKPAGWVNRGVISLDGQTFADLKTVKLAWDFDPEFGEWLKTLKKSRKR